MRTNRYPPPIFTPSPPTSRYRGSRPRRPPARSAPRPWCAPWCRPRRRGRRWPCVGVGVLGCWVSGGGMQCIYIHTHIYTHTQKYMQQTHTHITHHNRFAPPPQKKYAPRHAGHDFGGGHLRHQRAHAGERLGGQPRAVGVEPRGRHEDDGDLFFFLIGKGRWGWWLVGWVVN